MPGYMSETDEVIEFTKDTPPQEIHDKLANADKITALNVTLDTKKMREDGVLLNGEDYTPERFLDLLKHMCQSNNADLVTRKAKVTMPCGRTTWGYCGVKVRSKRAAPWTTYRFKYIGFWRYAWNIAYELELDRTKSRESKWQRRWCAILAAVKTVWRMRSARFREFSRDTLRRYIWRQTPAFMAGDILNKPEGRQPNGDHDISSEGMDV